MVWVLNWFIEKGSDKPFGGGHHHYLLNSRKIRNLSQNSAQTSRSNEVSDARRYHKDWKASEDKFKQKISIIHDIREAKTLADLG